jgi:hypothetical protein
MQCGGAALDPREPSELLPVSGFVEPAIIGGALLGTLSSLPIISLGNGLCCMWVVGGGALAAWLLRKKHPQGPESVTYGDGAFVGVLSGSFGAIIATAILIPVRLLSAEALRAEMETVEEMLPEFEGPIRELFLRLLSPELSFVTILATFFMHLVIFSLFSMVGGILLLAIMGRKSDNSVPPTTRTDR